MFNLPETFGNKYIVGQLLMFVHVGSLVADHFYHRGHCIKGGNTIYAVVCLFWKPPTHAFCKANDPNPSILYSRIIWWGEVCEGFFLLPCNAIVSGTIVVPNVPVLHNPKLMHESKKRKQEITQNTGAVDPIGGFFVVSSRKQWARDFELIIGTEDEEREML